MRSAPHCAILQTPLHRFASKHAVFYESAPLELLLCPRAPLEPLLSSNSPRTPHLLLLSQRLLFPLLLLELPLWV